MRTVLLRVAAVLVLALALAVPASAQQTFSVNLGYFALRGNDARVNGDVLLANLGLDGSNSLPLFFETKDFNYATISGEWLVPIGEFLEAGAGIGFYQRTVPSVYDTVTKPGNIEIRQDLKLRTVPITASVRVLPLGRSAPIQPYIGAGIGVIIWRYSETGEFVDDRDLSIFADRFVKDGTNVGPVIMGGVRLPIGDHFATGGEIRYQKAEGSLPPDRFLGSKIDLGGVTYSWLVQFRFP